MEEKITTLNSKEVEFTLVCETDSLLLERGAWAWSLYMGRISTGRFV